MNGKQGHTLSLNLKIFLILLMIATGGIMVGVHIMSIMRRDCRATAMQTGLSGNTSGQAAGHPLPVPPLTNDLHQMEISGLALLSILMAMPFIGAWLVNSWVTRPINAMTRVTAKMIDGHLDETVSCSKHAEIGRLGELINDFSVNYQEMLLFVWDQSKKSAALADDIIIRLHAQPDGPITHETIADMESMKCAIDRMRSMIGTFGLYDILLDENGILMGNDIFTGGTDAE